MSRRPKETRSWPEKEGEEALSALREGLARLHSGVAAFREMIQVPEAAERADAPVEARAENHQR